jgi:hypothetical protein
VALCCCLSGLLLNACDRPVHDFDSRQLRMEPRPGVTVTAVIRTLVDRSDVVRGMTFLNFDYTLTNESQAPVYFSVSEVRLRVAGVMSMDSWYALSSVDHIRGWDTIKVGEKRGYQLYTAFNAPLVLGDNPVVEVALPGIK